MCRHIVIGQGLDILEPSSMKVVIEECKNVGENILEYN